MEINNLTILSNTNRIVLHTPRIWINAPGKFVPSDRQICFEKCGYQTENSYALCPFDFSITTCVLKEELLWKLIVMLGPDDYYTLANPENPSAITPLRQLTSLRPGQLQGTYNEVSHKSTCSNIETRINRPKSVARVIRGVAYTVYISRLFVIKELTCTESATSEYSTTSQRLSALRPQGRLGSVTVKFALHVLW